MCYVLGNKKQFFPDVTASVSFLIQGIYILDIKLKLLKVADRKNFLVRGLQFICDGGIGKKDYGGLIFHIGTLNPTVLEEP